ncbi:MAG: hypothetical protein AAF404_16585, partial [Pseudomonadota bacterium]
KTCQCFTSNNQAASNVIAATITLHVLFNNVTAVQHGLITLWTPDFSSFNVIVAAMTLLAAWLLLVKHWHVLAVLLTLALTGLVSTLVQPVFAAF